MDMEIIKQESQPLLSRTEVNAKVLFEGVTPSRYQILKSLSTKLKSKEELTVVKHINCSFGSQEAFIEAYIYDKQDVMSVLEKNPRKADAPKVEEKPAEPTPESDKPTEEKSE